MVTWSSPGSVGGHNYGLVQALLVVIWSSSGSVGGHIV